jgi:hypothetical protein
MTFLIGLFLGAIMGIAAISLLIVSRGDYDRALPPEMDDGLDADR